MAVPSFMSEVAVGRLSGDYKAIAGQLAGVVNEANGRLGKSNVWATCILGSARVSEDLIAECDRRAAGK